MPNNVEGLESLELLNGDEDLSVFELKLVSTVPDTPNSKGNTNQPHHLQFLTIKRILKQVREPIPNIQRERTKKKGSSKVMELSSLHVCPAYLLPMIKENQFGLFCPWFTCLSELAFTSNRINY